MTASWAMIRPHLSRERRVTNEGDVQCGRRNVKVARQEVGILGLPHDSFWAGAKLYDTHGRPFLPAGL
jgi:hypothetical protein